ncbi:MAG TPA: metalloprotease TldD [Thermodesulfobacteriota bacterium]
MSLTEPVHPVVPDRFFESRFGLTPDRVGQTLGGTLRAAVDYADLFVEHTVRESIALEEGIVKKASRAVEQGAGVRVLAGEKTGYAHTDDLSTKALRAAAEAARAIAEGGGARGASVAVTPIGRPRHDLYPAVEPAVDRPIADKVRLLEEIDRLARAIDPRVTKVVASFSAEHKVVLVAGSDGRMVGDVQPLVRLTVQVIARDGENRQVGTYGGGGRYPFEWFLEERRWERFTREAVRIALVNLDAVDAPAGEMTVVLGPGWPGILLHEAVGHGLEGDFNRKKLSAFSGRIGERVASDLVTVVDDGTLPGRRGSLNVDDEGVPTSRTVLIEKGILKGYLQDRLNARLMGMALTGNGRRESYRHVVMPRMTNTFMLAGTDDPADILRSVGRGLYAVNFGGGQVDITNGKFVFSASEAYLIEDGRPTRPVKGATLIGNGPDVLTRVSAVGHDLMLDEGVGTCGKDGQSVPVGVGLPTIRIDGLTVGGTKG